MCPVKSLIVLFPSKASSYNEVLFMCLDLIASFIVVLTSSP